MSDRSVALPVRRALFGKLPAHGDFVRRGDAALVQRLDHWLTGEVERLASDPDEPYEAVLNDLPLWCFVLKDGLAGALAGSHDRVGRIFPVVVMAGGGEVTANIAAAVLREATSGALDADGVYNADWPDAEAEPCAAAATGWWQPPATDRVSLAILPTGPDFALLMPGEAG